MLAGLAFLPGLPAIAAATVRPRALTEFNAYVAQVESRLARQHRSSADFLVPVDPALLHSGSPVIQELTPSAGLSLPGALLHDWRGTAFIPGATAAGFVRVMTGFSDWPQEFSPQVLSVHVLRGEGNEYRVLMRVRQHHILTITLDETSAITITALSSHRGYSIAHSSDIVEIGADGRPLSPDKEHGFLWRLDTWWTWQERDGGLEVQIESVSLSRSIPIGLGWLVKPYVRSIPRDSLAFTLHSVCRALLQQHAAPTHFSSRLPAAASALRSHASAAVSAPSPPPGWLLNPLPHPRTRLAARLPAAPDSAAKTR